MRLGTAVKDLRKRAGLRQEDLAERVGVTQSYLSQIENDRKEPNLSTLRRIGQELGVSLPILFFLSMDEEDVHPERKETFDRMFPYLKDLVEDQLVAGA